MSKFRTGLLLTAFLLLGCDHHGPTGQVQEQGASVAENDAALTGLPPTPANPPAKPAPDPVYPRATLVTLPADTPPAALNPSTDSPPSPLPPSDSLPTEPPRLTPTPPVLTVAPTDPMPDSSPTMTPAPAPVPASAPVPGPAPAPVIVDTPPSPSDTEKQVAVLETSLGRIVIELDDDAAPQTCANFRKLVSSGFYNKTAFHRVIPHFIIQGGDPNSKSDDRATYGQGGPGYTVPAEIKLTHDLGAVAMARSPDSINPQRESNGSQFYICVASCPSLDDKNTVFGHVIKGLDVVTKIAEQDRDARDNPTTKIEMEASLQPKDKAMAEANNP